MIDTVQQACQDYYNELPEHTLRAIGLSAVCTFTASTIVATLFAGLNQPVSFSRAFLATTLSVVASTIHALTTPLFNYLFNNTARDYNGFQDFIQTLTDITLTHLLINHATAYKVNIITATNISGDNFIILPHTLFKSSLDMILRTMDFYNPVRPQIQQIAAQYGLNLQANPNVVYVAI